MMIHQLSLREMNQHFSQYIQSVESGEEIVLTRHGRPVAKIIPIQHEEIFTPEQLAAKKRLFEALNHGFHLKNRSINRDELHER